MKKKAGEDNLKGTADSTEKVHALVIPVAGSFRYNVPALQREFDFSFLKGIFSEDYIDKIARSLCNHLTRYARKTALSRFGAFRRVFSEGFSSMASRLDAAPFGNDIFKRVEELQARLSDWFNTAKAKYSDTLTTLGELVNSVRPCLACLYEAGIFPRLADLKMPKNYHSGRKRRPSLAELTTDINLNSDLFPELIEKLKLVDSSLSTEEAEAVLRSIASQTTLTASNSLDALANAMHRRTNYLLDIVRKICEKNYIKWQEVYEYGAKIIELASPDALLIYDSYLTGNTRKRQELYPLLFPSDNLDLARANFLNICLKRYGGLVPSGDEWEPGVSRYLPLMSFLGGKHYLSAMLVAHPDAVAAAIITYLVDTGANVSVALDLKQYAERPTDEPGWFTYSSNKDRAGQKNIISTLPLVDKNYAVSCVAMLRGIRRMTERARQASDTNDDSLFYYVFRSEPSIANSSFVQNRLSYFLREANLSSLNLKVGAIRVSYLLKHTMEGGDNLRIAQVLADHEGGNGVTETYALRWPVRAKYVHLIRHFQETLVAQLQSGNIGSLESYGSAAVKGEPHGNMGAYSSRVNPFQGKLTGLERPSKDSMNSAEDECETKVVVVNRNTLIEALVINASLRTQSAELEAHKTLRWESAYLPMLAFTDVLLEKVGRSKFANILRQARIEADTILLTSGPIPF